MYWPDLSGCHNFARHYLWITGKKILHQPQSPGTPPESSTFGIRTDGTEFNALSTSFAG
jgi:hypothetical protein